jgi:hypothetical protein
MTLTPNHIRLVNLFLFFGFTCNLIRSSIFQTADDVQSGGMQSGDYSRWQLNIHLLSEQLMASTLTQQELEAVKTVLNVGSNIIGAWPDMKKRSISANESVILASVGTQLGLAIWQHQQKNDASRTNTPFRQIDPTELYGGSC